MTLISFGAKYMHKMMKMANAFMRANIEQDTMCSVFCNSNMNSGKRGLSYLRNGKDEVNRID